MNMRLTARHFIALRIQNIDGYGDPGFAGNSFCGDWALMRLDVDTPTYIP
jgi:hypothetical protein